MALDSTGKNEIMMILGRLSALVATGATARLRFALIELLAGAVAALFAIGIAALRAGNAGGRYRPSRYQLEPVQTEVQG